MYIKKYLKEQASRMLLGNKLKTPVSIGWISFIFEDRAE